MENNSPIQFSVLTSLKGHHGNVRSVLYFGQPLEVIVSGGHDNTIRIWSSKTHKELVKIDDVHNQWVNQLVKFEIEKGIFLSCDYDGLVCSIQLLKRIPYFQVLERYRLSECCVERLVKLSDEFFGMLTYMNEILIVDYREKKIIKRMNMGKSSWYSRLVKSKSITNGLFFSTTDCFRTIVLIDYETCSTVREYKGHPAGSGAFDVNFITTYMNEQNKEVLVAGGDSKDVCFYDIHSSTILWKYRTTNSAMSLICLRKGYLGVADEFGYFDLVDLTNREPLLIKKSLHALPGEDGDWVYEMTVMEMGRNSVKLVSSGRDWNVNIFELKNLRLGNNEEEEDLVERISYLNDSKELIMVGVKDEEITLSLIGFSIENISKYLF